MNFIVVGIHTGIGKTICSAILCNALNANYWKPIQAGDLEQSDSIFIRNHTENVEVFEEGYKLNIAASPHYAARCQGIEIQLDKLTPPHSPKPLIIETAGGIMSPISDNKVLNIDFIKHLALPVILVSENYLGSINHTLLSIDKLQRENIAIKGIVFNGDKNVETEDFILKYTQLNKIFSIPRFDLLNKTNLIEFSKTLNLNFN